MRHTPGQSVIDVYDDFGNTLKEKVASVNTLPDYIKKLAFKSQEFLSDQPDNTFAFVTNTANGKLRKFACLDKAHTAVNVMYFMEGQNKPVPVFTKEAEQKIAENLISACYCFDLLPPTQLVKMSQQKRLIQGDGAEIIVNKKEADLNGTETMPYSTGKSSGTKRLEKVAAAMSNRVIDNAFANYNPSQSRDPRICALESEDGTGDFPLVTYGQVKEAADFFAEQGMRLHPRTRRSFCVKVAARANVIGVDVDQTIKKYGSAGYSPDNELNMHVERRRQLWRDAGDHEGVSLLDALMEKKASMRPDDFAEALAQIDIVMGADRLWNKDIADPWYTSIGKEAQDAGWSWQQGTEHLSEYELKSLAQNGKTVVAKTFGEDLANALEREPISIFDSLPLEQKTIIARMAQSQGTMM